MTTHLVLVSLALSFATACASHDGRGEGSQPVEDPKPASAVTVSIASVQMIQDCADPPDPAPTEPPAAMPAQKPAAASEIAPGAAARAVPGDGPGFHQPCTQSTMQLELFNEGDAGAKASVRAVRLLAPGSLRKLGTLSARKPSSWDQGGTYRPWDEKVAANTKMVASYRLSMPDWGEVERELGTSSMGKMFVIEVDVEIDGEVQTVRSPEFPREEPHVIVT